MLDGLKMAAISLISTVILAAGGAAVSAESNNNNNNSGNSNPGNDVTLCHATGSQTNPYVKITVNSNGALGHAGSKHQDGRDIIPPFTYNNQGQNASFPGQNWDAAGQATFNNNCVPPTPGQGGGGEVLGTNVTPSTPQAAAPAPAGGAGAAQIQAIPQGGVGAGAGGGDGSISLLAAAGIGGSLASLAGGLLWSYRRANVAVK